MSYVGMGSEFINHLPLLMTLFPADRFLAISVVMLVQHEKSGAEEPKVKVTLHRQKTDWVSINIQH